jgi:hypothetical protein
MRIGAVIIVRIIVFFCISCAARTFIPDIDTGCVMIMSIRAVMTASYTVFI